MTPGRCASWASTCTKIMDSGYSQGHLWWVAPEKLWRVNVSHFTGWVLRCVNVRHFTGCVPECLEVRPICDGGCVYFIEWWVQIFDGGCVKCNKMLTLLWQRRTSPGGHLVGLTIDRCIICLWIEWYNVSCLPILTEVQALQQREPKFTELSQGRQTITGQWKGS